MTAAKSACTFLKNLSKLVSFCVAILILKMEENTAHFQCTMLYHFKKGKDKENKICAMYGEGPVTD